MRQALPRHTCIWACLCTSAEWRLRDEGPATPAPERYAQRLKWWLRDEEPATPSFGRYAQRLKWWLRDEAPATPALERACAAVLFQNDTIQPENRVITRKTGGTL